MRLKLLLDMNLSPEFASYLRKRGVDAAHWFEIGNPEASDAEIISYAAEHGYVVVTLDLDFSAILAATQGKEPSVVQIRAKEAISEKIFVSTLAAIEQVKDELAEGAILTIDMEKSRLRLLPLG
jgi:predicted nuclease of predicted toxin-antitoxin system